MLQSEREPRIESFLAGWDGAERRELLGYLLELEIEYREHAGDQVDRSEYLGRFPEAAAFVLSDGRDKDPPATSIPTLCSYDPVGAPPQQIGDYSIDREIGRGGMGAVFEAHQQSLDRRVALKVLLLPGSRDDEALERFHQEAQLAAKLHHTNIVPVFEVGTANGVSFFAMQLIDGPSLDVVRKAAQRTVQEPSSHDVEAFDLVTSEFVGDLTTRRGRQAYFYRVADLGQHVAEALGYAHRHHVVHRDVKPSNLLLDRDGVVWVTDFGLATSQDSDLTRTGDLLGTLRYMSPERFQGDSNQSGDIYGLGVTLYELLTLRPAFDGSDQLQLIETISRQEPRSPRSLQPELPRDLEVIVQKAMRKDVRDRYPTAEAMARDLRCFVNGQPIAARRMSTSERLTRWCGRNPVVASLLASVALLLLTTSIISFSAAMERGRMVTKEADLRKQANDHREDTEDRLVVFHTSHGQRLVEQGRFADALPWLAEATRLDGLHAVQRDASPHPAHRMRFASALRNCPKFSQLWVNEYGLNDVAMSADETMIAAACVDNAVRVWSTETGQPIGDPLVHQGEVKFVRFHPRKKLVASSLSDGGLLLWNLEDATFKALPSHSTQINGLAFHPESGHLASAAEDGTIRFWNVETREPMPVVLRHAGAVLSIRFSRLRAELLSSSQDGTGRLWDVASGKELLRLEHGKSVTSASFGPAEVLLLTSSMDGTAQVWNRQGEAVAPPITHRDGIRDAAVSPDGKSIATASEDGSALIWDLKTSSPRTPRLQHDGYVSQVSFSPDGHYLLTSSDDFHVRLWRVSDGELVLTPLPHGGEIISARFLHDGRRILTTSYGRVAYLWDLASAMPTLLPFEHAADVTHAEFSRDGHRVLTSSLDKTARVWSVAQERTEQQRLDHEFVVHHATWDPEEKVIATASGGKAGQLRLWSTTTGTALLEKTFEQPLRHVDYSPSGTQLLLRMSNAVAVYDVPSESITAMLEHDGNVSHAEFSPTGTWVVTCGYDRTARIWNARTGEARFEPFVHRGRVDFATFSHHGRWLVTTCSGEGKTESTIHLWDVESGRQIHEFTEHKAWYALHAGFHPHDDFVVSAGSVTAYIWDPETGQVTASPLRHQGMVERVQFSHDGRFVATASWDKAAHLWDASSGLAIGAPMQHDDWVHLATFDPACTRLLTASRDGTARLVDIRPAEGRAEELLAIGELLSAVRVDAQGGTEPLGPQDIKLRWAKIVSQRHWFAPNTAQKINWHRREAKRALAMGSRESARFHLEHVLELEPNAPWASQTLERL